METVVVEVEGNEEGKVEDSVNEIDESTEHIAADPVVYKLVRVDGDGRLVPATDDEIMAVGDLLEDDKSENPAQTAGCGMEKSCTFKENSSNSLKVAFPSNNMKAVTEKLNAQDEQAMDTETLSKQQEAVVPSLVPSFVHSSGSQPGTVEGCSNRQVGFIEKRSRISSTGSSWKPDFSKLKGDLHLDNLTVRELQETFKATFGRETSVKDKQWLKRRIIMGLTHSCDFSATSLVIKDGIVVKIAKERSSKRDGKVSKEAVGVIVSKSSGGSSIDDRQLEDHSSGRKGMESSSEYNCAGEDHNAEQRATKRVRKPTKRYIEELSEVESRESSGKSASLNKYVGHAQLLPEASIGSLPTVQCSRPLVTRQDSLGGSGVQVPYVSRVRRGRPREDIMALVPNSIGMAAARLVEKGLVIRSPRLDDKKEYEVLKSQLSSERIQVPEISFVFMATDEKIYQNGTTKFMELEAGTELQNMDSFADSSEDNAAATNMPQGRMRRKHHRPWALSEVVKLVEGVAKYGAGRWSEIKRVAFASSPYRTSVDLKDKWRNLLRASFAQLPAGKEMQNSRKHSSIPIPAPILIRVRELAEMQAQVPPIIGSSKFSGHSSDCLARSLHETRSGYL